MVDAYDDSRDFRRMEINCEVVVHRIAEDVIITGKAINLSATGFSFVCDDKLQFDEELEIKITPGQEGLTPPLHAMVRVVHVNETTESTYAIGCVISSMLS